MTGTSAGLPDAGPAAPVPASSGPGPGRADGDVAGGIPLALMRGGTSKGIVLLAEDLPAEPAARDDLLLRLMGSPDPRQIDGLGGAHPLTSKVAIVSRASGPEADVDYLFCQVGVEEGVVSTSQTCGNMLAAVGPFAILRGLVPARDGVTRVRVRMLNTGQLATLTVRTPGGRVTFDGDTAITGVPGTAAPVEIAFAGGERALLPTGRRSEVVAGLSATLIDAGMPSVLLRAADLGLTGGEDPAELEGDAELVARIGVVRAEAFTRMGLAGTPETTSTPKIVLLSAPAAGGTIRTRSFIPHRVHQAVGVLGAASVAAAVRLAGTVADGLADVRGAEADGLADVRGADANGLADPAIGVAPADTGTVRVEHPTGHLDLGVELEEGDVPRVVEIRDIRTARLLADAVAHPRR